jgi:uncharacterized protein
VIGSGAGIGLRSMPMEQMIGLSWMPLAMAASFAVGTVPFALAYIATATLLLERAAWRRRLGLFAPVGRMALTNYLAQTVLCITIYYAGGLVGQAGPLFGLLLALVIFPAQMLASAWWLARFRYGPMEWLWRSLTYGRLQPMRLAQPAVSTVSPPVETSL